MLACLKGVELRSRGANRILTLFKRGSLLDAELSQQVDALLLRTILVNVMTLIAVLNLEAEFECCSTLTITKHGDVATLILADDLAESEAKAHALWIHPAATLDQYEGFPDALLVFKCYSRALVLHDH